MSSGERAASSRTVLMPTAMASGRVRSLMKASTSCFMTGASASGGTCSCVACAYRSGHGQG